MVISDRFRFAFVHIPKCAGTSIRSALRAYDDTGGAYTERVETHPLIGPLDYVHIPLAVLQSAFPAAFAKLSAYRSFAVLRDPMDRFRSALAQRLFQYRDRKIEQYGDDDLRREIDAVIEELEVATLPIIRPDLIHFARQVDYVVHDGVRVVEDLYDITQLAELGRDLSQVIGDRLEVGQENRSYIARSDAARWTIRRLTPISRRVRPLPGAMQVRSLLRSLLTVPMTEQLPASLSTDEVRAFVRDFYRDDYRLRDSCGFATGG